MISTSLLNSILGYILVAILWGCTNPFLKHAQQSYASQHSKSDDNLPEYLLSKEHKVEVKTSLLKNLYNLVTNLKLSIPFAINQCGSVAFCFLLSSEPVSRVNPICNSLTFLFTAVTGYFFFGEVVRFPLLLIIGCIFIIVVGIFKDSSIV